MPEQAGSRESGSIVGGRYRVEGLIGRGGMGEVYSAKHVATGKSVALKLIRTTAPRTAAQTRRFLTEARAATAIPHPNVIKVFDLFEDDDGTLLMVMELLQGESLGKLQARVGALTLHEVASIMVPVAKALKAAHGKGIIHRDLKPDNIFLAVEADGTQVPKVLDFGIAKILDPAKIGAETPGHPTSVGSPLGTPQYMSFEQAMSEKVDHRTDIWGLGVIVFEALCGRRPFEFETLGEMYMAFLQRPVPRIREWVPALPPGVASIIDRCLEKTRDTRLDSIDPFIEAFAPYLDPDAPEGKVGGVIAKRSTAPRRRSWMFPVASVVALGGVAAAVALSRGGGAPLSSTTAQVAATSVLPIPTTDTSTAEIQARSLAPSPASVPTTSSSLTRRRESISAAPAKTSARGREIPPSASSTAAAERPTKGIIQIPPY